jgi:hypothetical protein
VGNGIFTTESNDYGTVHRSVGDQSFSELDYLVAAPAFFFLPKTLNIFWEVKI